VVETATLASLIRDCRRALPALAGLDSAVKVGALQRIADLLEPKRDAILSANARDMDDARAGGMDSAMLDRLLLTPERIAGMAADVRHVASLPDPIGEEIEARTLPNGLQLSRRRVPLGLIGVVYESRPNVTVDVSVLCLMSCNAVILRGGKEARRSSEALAEVIRAALRDCDMPESAVQIIADPDRSLVLEMIRARGEIDLVVPRGGSRLIEFVRENAQVPVVTGGIGVCHTFVDRDADLVMALEIVNNAKTRRPTICNALDTVLVDRSIAGSFLPALAERWSEAGVEMRCCPESAAILDSAALPARYSLAKPDDFGREFLSLRAAIKIVDDLDEAIGHIETFGSGHSEAIVTESPDAANAFVNRVDAAAVYVNASTQFTDGGQFGLGAEVGISTQKFHARGPLGLRELTSYKWVVRGSGQIRS